MGEDSRILLAFETRQVPQAFYNSVLVLIPKPGKAAFRGIALLETVYKLVLMIIHPRLTLTIILHESIHGFRQYQGTGTAIINLKILLQKVQRDSNPLNLVFLDLTKAYNTLDRDRMLQLLQAYGVGPNICQIINNIWTNDTLILKQHQYYAKAMKTSRGKRQGNMMSPTLFNIMVDAVV
jgi:Reverse transcriptase (RNA-dependent DNA polymerase)